MIVKACAYCGTTEGPFHLDHVVPRSRGGPDSPRNLVTACALCNGKKSDLLPSEWLAVVPPDVAAIEARICASIEVRIRAIRGPKPSESVPYLECSQCGLDVVAPFKADNETGWLSWWVEPSSNLVQNVDVTCHASTSPYCFDRLERLRDGLLDFDGHLRWFTGRCALPQMWRLLRDYQWADRPRERLLDVFFVLAQLPDGEMTLR